MLQFSSLFVALAQIMHPHPATSIPGTDASIVRQIADIYSTRIRHAEYELQVIRQQEHIKQDWEVFLTIRIAVSEFLRGFYLDLANALNTDQPSS